MFTEVSDRSQVAEARRKVAELAARVGLAHERVDQVAIVVTELATNLLKHGGGGHLHASRCDDAGGVGLEVLALDRGGGMANPSRCLQDGYSTAGSPGNGLGAVARLTDILQIYTRAGQGCVLMCRFMTQPAPARRGMLGVTLAPYPGEQVCGDAWSWSDIEPGPTIMLADGSGHGVEAARAAELAARTFERNAGASCEELVGIIHRALTPTRGAAIAVARIDRSAHLVRFVGLGNISAMLASADKVRHMVSHNGTAGHVAPRIREFTYEFSGDPLVIMHSDGLTSRWNLDNYPGLLSHHPSVIAGVLLRDHRRERDDASVVVMANSA
jgi:anti-sigma regulatory factor (Ser/Thr protein kinase)